MIRVVEVYQKDLLTPPKRSTLSCVLVNLVRFKSFFYFIKPCLSRKKYNFDTPLIFGTRSVILHFWMRVVSLLRFPSLSESLLNRKR